MTRLSTIERSDLELILRHAQERKSAVCTALMPPIPPEYVGIFQEVAKYVGSGAIPDVLKKELSFLAILLGNSKPVLESTFLMVKVH